MNNLNKLLVLILSFTIFSCKQSQIDQLKDDLEDNSLLVLNDKYVILEPTEFLNQLSDNFLLSYQVLTNEEIKYENSFETIIKVFTDTAAQAAFNEVDWHEYRFIKEIDPNQTMFYMLDGMPVFDYAGAYGYLRNRLITKLNFIPANQAIAIWGNGHGKNGAIQIWTEKNPNEVIIPIIVK